MYTLQYIYQFAHARTEFVLASYGQNNVLYGAKHVLRDPQKHISLPVV